MKNPLLLVVHYFPNLLKFGACALPSRRFVIPKDGSVIKQAPEKMEIVFTAPAKLIKLEFFRVNSRRKICEKL